jgi:hypothetical protein
VDPITRDTLRARVDRHRRSRWWNLAGRSRCRCCRFRWPCAAYLDALRVLEVTAAPRRLAVVTTEPQPRLGPPNSRGQKYGTGRWTA